MHAAKPVLGALAIAMLSVVACGGAVEPDPAQRPTAQSVPVPKGAENNGGGGDGAGNGGPTCITHAVSVSHACIPLALRSKAPLRIYAEDNGCYAGSCEGATALKSCKVRVEGNTISLGIELHACTTTKPGDGQTCSSDCRPLGVECDLPALEVGTYRIRGEKTDSATSPPLDRTLEIRDDTTADVCVNVWGSELAKP